MGMEGEIKLDSDQKAAETVGNARTDGDGNLHTVWQSGRHGGTQIGLMPAWGNARVSRETARPRGQNARRIFLERN